MSTAELKSTLHRYIVETDDLSVLEKVKAFFQELKNSAPDNVELTALEEKMLKLGLEQADKGLLIPNQDVRTQLNQWLKEKQK